MAAKLRWDGDKLVLEHRDGFTQGERVVAEVRGAAGAWVYEIRRGLVIHVSGTYEKICDARQDCEAEVRRLLKVAGVEVA